ncbi:phosphoribosylaminoimidazole-succinocarboxamide synthase [Cytobacillus eiseniae]|uniref:Multifunctional fusion protein n=2 Tax=Cytobacillus eiseniae TaxID=762947 RepID=A0ABS4RDB4_9BACI|nr:phosphoribosylaminoimidazole-succinocarboxamide synthase [Cytobacillus eiseniae]
MEKGTLLYEGKAKKVYQTNNDDIVWIEYKDSATAFNGEKKASIAGKGRLNNEITSLLFSKLQALGIDSHFIKKLSATEQLVKKVEIIPLETVVRNFSAGSFAKRLGVEEGAKLARPIVEFYYKDDALGDPLLIEDHIEILQLANSDEVAILKEKALQVNTVLSELFKELGIRLVDFKLEFGKDENGNILLADEISPDTCRLWDDKTNEKLDKDVFRRDLGNLTDAYETILARLRRPISMYKVKVFVTLRESVLDPQGTVVKNSLHSLNYSEVSDVRIGKYMELTIDKSDRPVDEVVKDMCERLLANVVIEDYRYEIEEAVAQ